MAKITSLDMTLMQVLSAMSEGNVGALTTMMRVVKEGGTIDPDIGDGFMILLHMDTLELYGTNIWILFKYVCGENLNAFIAVIRSYQMGLLTREEIHAMVEKRELIDTKALFDKLSEELPAFVTGLAF